MPREESLIPDDWLEFAEDDLTRVATLLREHDPRGAGFHLQQALEKFLKAFLLSRGWQLVRTHDLEALLNEAANHDPSLDRFRAPCQTIAGYYFVNRYPFVPVPALTEGDIRQSLAEVEGLIRTLRGAAH